MHSDFYINLCVRHWVSALHLMFSSSQFFALVILSLSKHKELGIEKSRSLFSFCFPSVPRPFGSRFGDCVGLGLWCCFGSYLCIVFLELCCISCDKVT